MFSLLTSAALLTEQWHMVAALPSLVGVYVVCLIVGGGLIVISTVFAGDTHANADVDVHVEVDTDVDFDAGHAVDVDLDAAHAHAAFGVSLASWFSIRFVVYFLAAFGVVGTALSYGSSVGPAIILLSSLAGGVVVGQAVHQVLRYLKRTSGSGVITAADYVNKIGRVTIAIEPAGRGEVAVQVSGRERFVPAVASRKNDRFEVGDRVAVASFAGGTAQVVSQKEHEFLTDSNRGG